MLLLKAQKTYCFEYRFTLRELDAIIFNAEKNIAKSRFNDLRKSGSVHNFFPIVKKKSFKQFICSALLGFRLS